MIRRILAIVAEVLDAGPDDPVFEILLLLGPPVVMFIALSGRSIAGYLFAGVYLFAFVGNVLYRGSS